MTEKRWTKRRGVWIGLLLAGVLLLATAVWALPGLGTVGAAPSVSASLSYSAPGTLSYQGQVHVDGSPFDGMGQFKFAIVNAAGTQMYWANDGSTGAVAEPGTAVSVPVEDGLFSVLLGDTSLSNMDAEIPADAFSEPDRALRVWFNDGANGFEMLTPDTSLASVPYAFQADQARVAPNLERIALLKWRQGGGYADHPDRTGPGLDTPWDVVYDGESIWVSEFTGNCVSKWDADTTEHYDCYGTSIQTPTGLAFDGRYVWVANAGADTVTLKAAYNGGTVASIDVGDFPYHLAFTGRAMWVANRDADSITMIDASTRSVIETCPTDDGPHFVAFDGEHMWVSHWGAGTVKAFNLGSCNSVVHTVDVFTALDMAFDGSLLWVVSEQGDEVVAIDVETGEIEMTVPVGTHPRGIAFDGENIWVTDSDDAIATIIDVRDGSIVNTVEVGGGAYGIAFDGANMWIANELDNSLSKR